jgi:hydrogenase expression/formation protein HypD
MKEYRDKKIIRALLKRIEEETQGLPAPVRIMEVCGTHTMTIHKYGLKIMLETAGIEMLSGPGCPVCITPDEFHEAALDLVTKRENLVLATFGDMTRVPTGKGSLQTAIPAHDSLIKIVYSPEEAAEIAKSQSEKEVVFFGVGFETTIPSIALTVKNAASAKLANFSVLSALWLIPPPLRAILEAGETRINGFLYPGHVSVIIGKKPYEFIAKEYGIPGAIAGFEPSDILLGICAVIDQIKQKKPGVHIEYTRAVSPAGNPKALALMEEVLEEKDACWRGLGTIPRSGLRLKKKYSGFDAEVKYGLKISGKTSDQPGCRCGEVLKGLVSPPQCPLYSRKCTPESPHGPCMVSLEGACLIYYKYQE